MKKINNIEDGPHSLRVKELVSLVNNTDSADILLVGDSWFEYYQSGPSEEYLGNYSADFENLNVLNLGIGGATFAEYRNYIDILLNKFNPKVIVINLGFNDIHSNKAIYPIYFDAVDFIETLRNKFIHSKIMVLSVCQSYSSKKYIKNETEYNHLIKEFCKGKNYLYYIDTAASFYKNNNYIKDFNSYFVTLNDGYHLNKKGYELWSKDFKNILKKEINI